jgi:hypothetical protein
MNTLTNTTEIKPVNIIIILFIIGLFYLIFTVPPNAPAVKPPVTTTLIFGTLVINADDRILSNDECAQFIFDTIHNYDTSKVSKISVFDKNSQVCFYVLTKDEGIVYISNLLKR